ncbi:hypothetical protein CLAIMM_03236 isoform 2, partial [Cladophialophora immunda]
RETSIPAAFELHRFLTGGPPIPLVPGSTQQHMRCPQQNREMAAQAQSGSQDQQPHHPQRRHRIFGFQGPGPVDPLAFRPCIASAYENKLGTEVWALVAGWWTAPKTPHSHRIFDS